MKAEAAARAPQEAYGATWRSSCSCCCFKVKQNRDQNRSNSEENLRAPSQQPRPASPTQKGTGLRLPLVTEEDLAGELQAMAQRPLPRARVSRRSPKSISSQQVKRGASELLNPRDSQLPQQGGLGPLGALSAAPPSEVLREPPLPSVRPQLITKVPFHVPSQVGSPPEGLPALGALEGPLASVEPPVADELGGLAERFPARAALVTLLCHG